MDVLVMQQNQDMSMSCSDCGSLCCYVDDSTYMYSSYDPAVITEKLSYQYKKLSEHMVDNKIGINDDKTNLQVCIDTGTVVVKPNFYG